MVRADCKQHPHVRALHRGRPVVAGLRIAVGRRQQRVVGMDEADPLPAERHQPIQWWRIGPQGRRAEQKSLLAGAFVLVEQHHHQAGPAAEPAEQRAFADARGRGDVVHGDGVGAALGDQVAGRVQQERAVARRVTALLLNLLWSEHGQLAQPLDTAHSCTLARAGINRTMVRFRHAKM